jgi:lysozyme family protein
VITRFEQCLALVLKHEGGYSDHPADKGGATNRGITQAVYDDWRIGQGFPRQPVSGIAANEVSKIYLSRYWKLGKCDQLPTPLDYVHFDGCVNHGNKQAAKFLQRALGVEDDGAIGPKTLAAVRQDDAVGSIELVCESILSQREDFYQALTENKPHQKVFLAGWNNRIRNIRETTIV